MCDKMRGKVGKVGVGGRVRWCGKLGMGWDGILRGGS